MKDLIFQIGRHRGLTLEYVWSFNSQYVIWFMNNIELPHEEKTKALDEIHRINKNPNNGKSKR